MQEEWFLLNSGHLDGAINMALDEALLNWHSEGKIPPTLRFYGWSQPTLSVGQFQKVERSIDFNAVHKYNCLFVRRLTGGSAVLHDDELTYSIVVSENHPKIPASIKEAYYILSKGLYEGYKNLGISVDYAYPDRDAIKERTDVCFEKAAYYEIIVDGKKLSGNAQTRQKGVLMQHGSIPMSLDIVMLYDLFRFSSEEFKVRRRNAFQDKAVTINGLTKKSHSYDEVRDAFQDGFKKGLNITLRPFELTKEQWDEVYQLAETKYRSEGWNYKRLVKEPRTSV